MSESIFSWESSISTDTITNYLKYEIYPDWIVKYGATSKVLGGRTDYREADRVAPSAIHWAHWVSQNQLDLDGHKPDGTYVILSCRGATENLQRLSAELAKSAPNLKIEEKN